MLDEMTISPAVAINKYGSLAREITNTADAPVVSYFGAWLLIAKYAKEVGLPSDFAYAEQILGMSLDDAQRTADELMAEIPDEISAGLAFWDDNHENTRPIIPSSAELDEWVATHSQGLIKSFPPVPDNTQQLLASVLAVKTLWETPLNEKDGVLYGSEKNVSAALYRTAAAGDVAMVSPKPAARLNVFSAIADPSRSPAEVWKAIEEISDGTADLIPWTPEGHSWSVRKISSQTPSNTPLLRVTLPKWSASVDMDVAKFPGMDDFLFRRVSGSARQKAIAKYDANGFEAAALTAAARGLSLGSEVDLVDIKVNHPHAVFAVYYEAMSAWSDIKLFESWVVPNS